MSEQRAGTNSIQTAISVLPILKLKKVGSDVPLVLFGGWIELELPLLYPKHSGCPDSGGQEKVMPYVGWYLSGPSTVIHLCAKYVIPMWRKWTF